MVSTIWQAMKPTPERPTAAMSLSTRVAPVRTMEYSSRLRSENLVPASMQGLFKKVLPHTMPIPMANSAAPTEGTNFAIPWAMSPMTRQAKKPGAFFKICSFTIAFFPVPLVFLSLWGLTRLDYTAPFI